MAKRPALVAVLVTGLLVGARIWFPGQPAHAQPLSAGQIAFATWAEFLGPRVWTTEGEAWTRISGTWTREPSKDLPVPAASIEVFSDGPSALVAVTASEVWVFTGSSWQSAGYPPLNPVTVEGQSFGRLKATHR